MSQSEDFEAARQEAKQRIGSARASLREAVKSAANYDYVLDDSLQEAEIQDLLATKVREVHAMCVHIQTWVAEVDAGNKRYVDLIRTLQEGDPSREPLLDKFRDDAYPVISQQMREAEAVVDDLQKRIEVYQKWQKGESVDQSVESWMEDSPGKKPESELKDFDFEEEAAVEPSENIGEGSKSMTSHEVSTPISESQDPMDALRLQLSDVSSISSPQVTTVSTTKIQLTPSKLVAQPVGNRPSTTASPAWPAGMTAPTAPTTEASTLFVSNTPATSAGSALFGSGNPSGNYSAPRSSTFMMSTNAQALPVMQQSQPQVQPRSILTGGSGLPHNVTFTGLPSMTQSTLTNSGGTGVGATFGYGPSHGSASVVQQAPPVSQHTPAYIQQPFARIPMSQAQVASQPMFGYSMGMVPPTGTTWVSVGAGSAQQPSYVPSQGVYTVPPPMYQQPNPAVLQPSSIAQQPIPVVQQPGSFVQQPVPAAQQMTPAPTQWTPQSLTPDIPKLQLPVFSGKRSEFRSFWQLFEETVHLKPGVSNAYKMLYLRNLLRGEPEQLVKAYGVDGAYYEAAIASLKDKYGDQAKLLNELHAEFDRITPAGESVSSARSTFTQVEILCRQMESAGQDLENPHIAYLISHRMPEWVIQAVLQAKSSSMLWSTKMLRDTIDKTISLREAAHDLRAPKPTAEKERQREGRQRGRREGSQPPRPTGAFATVTAPAEKASARRKCKFCEQQHFESDCSKYKTLKERQARVKELQLCWKCLAPGHFSKECKRTIKCFFCAAKHNSAYCVKHMSEAFSKSATSYKEQQKAGSSQQKGRQRSQSRRRKEKTAQCAAKVYMPDEEDGCPPREAWANVILTASATAVPAESDEDDDVLLLTRKVVVHNPQREAEHATAVVFLDNAAEATFISKDFAKKLKLKPVAEEDLLLRTMSTTTRTRHCNLYDLNLQLRDGTLLPVQAYEREKLVGPIRSLWVDHAEGSTPSRMKFNVEEYLVQPDIMIGADYYYALNVHRDVLLDDRCLVMKSDIGPMAVDVPPGMVKLASATVAEKKRKTPQDKELDEMLARLWSLTAIGITDDARETDAELAWKKFKETVKYVDGRYEAGWPWLEDKPNLPSNLPLAVKRLWSLWKQHEKNPALGDAYHKVFLGMKDLKVIEDVKVNPFTEKVEDNKYPTSYMPHMGVEREDSATTKLRMVHDASARTKGGRSLNDCLAKGDAGLTLIAVLLVCFRVFLIILAGDIAKAYWMVGLRREDRDACRFLYLRDHKKPPTKDNIVVYRFTRVPFGVVSSGFMLHAAIETHLEKTKTPLADEIRRFAYSDNITLFADDAKTAIKKVKEAKKLFEAAGMNVRNWSSNFRGLPEELGVSEMNVVSYFGMHWDQPRDELVISVKLPDELPPPTKRNVLSQMQKRFDPTGIISPAMLPAKTLIRDLCQQQKGWDEPLDEAEAKRWSSIVEEWRNVIIRLKRLVVPRRKGATYALISFGDASKIACGAAVYLVEYSDGGTVCKLLFAKSHLNSPKEATMPRLELVAAVIAMRALQFVFKSLRFECKLYLFLDSEVCLQWLHCDPSSLQRFVANRVKELHKALDCHVGYVSTHENPSDISSRGCTLSELGQNKLWWRGPGWASKPQEEWPHQPTLMKDIVEEVQMKRDQQAEAEDEQEPIPERSQEAICSAAICRRLDEDIFRSWLRKCRQTAWVLRFVRHRLMKQEVPNTGLAAREIRLAEQCLIRMDQKTHPPTSEEVEKFGLRPNNQGILCCNDRLQRGNLEGIARNPIFLARDSEVLPLVVTDIHHEILHGRTTPTLSEFRMRFWTTRGRQAVKQIVDRCLICRKRRARPYRLPEMAPLPRERLEVAEPYQFAAVDFFGPFSLKDPNQKEPSKAYGIILTCLSSRHTYVDVVSDLSTETFLQALRRFFALYERPDMILSDRGSQLVLASKIVPAVWNAQSKNQELERFFADQNITWKFIGTVSPWQGGVYERLIGLLKNRFRAMVGRRMLTLEEARVAFAEVSSTVNSRPIAYVPSEPFGQVLTPKDLVSPGRTRRPPVVVDPDDLEDPEFRLGRLSTEEKLAKMTRQSLQRLEESKRLFKSDYLGMLRERQMKHIRQGRTVDRKPQVGNVVLIYDDSLPQDIWPVGVIKSFNAAHKAMIRLVNVQKPHNVVLERPVSLLYFLESGGSAEADEVTAQEETTGSAEAEDAATVQEAARQEQDAGQDAVQQADTMTALPKQTRAVAPEQTEEVLPEQRAKGSRYGLRQTVKAPSRWIGSSLLILACMIAQALAGQQFTDMIEKCTEECACPGWTRACTLFAGKASKNSTAIFEPTLSFLEGIKVRECRLLFEPVTELNRQCTRKDVKKVHFVQLYDRTVHFIRGTHHLRHEVNEDHQRCKNATNAADAMHMECAPMYLENANGTRLYVKAWGFGAIAVFYEPILEATHTCDECELTCTAEGYQATIGQNATMFEICVEQNCRRHLKAEQKQQPMMLPWSAFDQESQMARQHIVEMRAWHQGQLIERIERVCRKPSRCEEITCVTCARMWQNPHCNPRAVLLVSVATLYALAFMVISFSLCLRRRRMNQEPCLQNQIPEATEHAEQKEGSTRLTDEGPSCSSAEPRVIEAASSSSAITRSGVRESLKKTSARVGEACRKLGRSGSRKHQEDSAGIEMEEFSRAYPAVKLPPMRVTAKLCIILLAVFMPTQAEACSDVISFSATDRRCTEDKQHSRCSYEHTRELTLQTYGQKTCFFLDDEKGRPHDALALGLDGIRQVCHPIAQYFVRPYHLETESRPRCYSMGSCQGYACAKLQANDSIEELPSSTSYPGVTKCEDTCGGWNCGCGLFQPACYFWRLYAHPIGRHAGAVFQCRWNIEVNVSVTVTSGSREETTSLMLDLDNPTGSWKGLSVSLTGLTNDPVRSWQTEFFSFEKRVALIPSSYKPGLKCFTLKEAEGFRNCTVDASVCECKKASGAAKCECPEDPSPFKFLNDGHHALPLTREEVSLHSEEGVIVAVTRRNLVNMQVKLSGLEATLRVENSRCDLYPETLSGCASCLTAATFSFRCISSLGKVLGHVYCPSARFAVTCLEEDVVQNVTLYLPKESVEEACYLLCSNSNTSFHLSGHLDPALVELERDPHAFMLGNLTMSTFSFRAWGTFFSQYLPAVSAFLFKLWLGLVIVGSVVLLVSLVIAFRITFPGLACCLVILVAFSSVAQEAMADKINLEGEWQQLAEYAKVLAEEDEAVMEKEQHEDGNEIQWREGEEVLELDAGAAPSKRSSSKKEKQAGARRPTRKEGRSSRPQPGEKGRRANCPRPSVKDRRLKRPVPKRLPSEERQSQLRWLRNETWLTLNAKKQGATLADMQKKLSLDGHDSIESRVKTLGYPCLAAFLKSAYMQHEVELIQREGKTIYLSKAKKGREAVDKKLKESVKRMKELRLEEADQKSNETAVLEADGMEPLPLEASQPLAEEQLEAPEEQQEPLPKENEAPNADEEPEAKKVVEEKQAGNEEAKLRPQEAAELREEGVEIPEADGPVQPPEAAIAEEVEVAVAEAPALRQMAAAQATSGTGIPETAGEAVAVVQRDVHRHRALAVSDLTPLEDLLLATGPIRFSPMDADRRYKWQRRFQPGVADLELVPAPAEPVPLAMRPVLEVALEALQQQPNPEALSVADFQRVLNEALVDKTVWTHEAAMRFHVKKISMDNAYEAEIRSQTTFIDRNVAKFPRRAPRISRPPHCPIDMPIAAVFLWKGMPLQLPWWPMLVAKERKLGLWPLERAFVVLNEEQAPGQGVDAVAPSNQNPGNGDRGSRGGTSDQEGGGPRSSGSRPNGASYQEGGALGGRSNDGRSSLDNRVKQMQASGRFHFAQRITGPERGLIVEMPTLRSEHAQARRIEVRCAIAPRLDEQESGSSGRKPQLRSLVVIPPHSSFAGAPPPKKRRSNEKPYAYVCEMCNKYHKTAIPPHAHPRFSDCPSQWGLPSSSA